MIISKNERLKVFIFLGLVLSTTQLVEPASTQEKASYQESISSEQVEPVSTQEEATSQESFSSEHSKENERQLPTADDHQNSYEILENVKLKNSDIVEESSVFKSDQNDDSYDYFEALSDKLNELSQKPHYKSSNKDSSDSVHSNSLKSEDEVQNQEITADERSDGNKEEKMNYNNVYSDLPHLSISGSKEQPENFEDEEFDSFANEGKLETPEEKDQPGYNEVKQAEEILGIRQKTKKESMDAVPQKPNYKEAYDLLTSAKELGNNQAKVLLGMSHLTGEDEPYVSHDTKLAMELFEDASQSGLPSAQRALGVLYSTGVETNSSQSKAVLYYTFAALGGDSFAQMALAFRYWSGISVAQSCESALKYYTLVADDVARKVGNVGTGQMVLRIRLIEEEEAPQNSPLLDEDLVQYYQFLADKGDLQAQLGLGQLYLQGGRGVDRNPKLAQGYFSAAAKAGNTNAYGYLGKISMQLKEYETAEQYFKQAIKDPMGQWGMGMLYYNGWGIAQDFAQALAHLTLAAQQGHTEAELQLGLMHLSGIGVTKDYGMALKHFNVASKSGHVLAFYNLGMMHASGVGVMRNCQTAAELLKNVAERGNWANELMDAHNLYHKGQVDSALIKYLILAEQGYEVAQTNAAYILDKEYTEFITNLKSRYKRAFVNWKRAAAQGFGGARLKLGDYYYYGQGTEADPSEAAEQYQIAIDVDSNPQAMFNLGYMHELGIGRQQDIHLAKRYYDMAASASTDALVPTMLANAKLQTKIHIEWLIQYYKNFTFAKFWASLVTFSSWHVEKVYNTFNSFANFLLELDNTTSEDWDIYLMSILAVVLGLVMAFRGHNQRRAQLRAAAVQQPQPPQ